MNSGLLVIVFFPSSTPTTFQFNQSFINSFCFFIIIYNSHYCFNILVLFVLAPFIQAFIGGGCAWGPHQKKSKESVCSGANKPQQKKREVGRACLCWGLWGGAHLPRLNFIPSIKLNWFHSIILAFFLSLLKRRRATSFLLL